MTSPIRYNDDPSRRGPRAECCNVLLGAYHEPWCPKMYPQPDKPVVLLVPAELLSVLTGSTVHTRTLAGREVVVRIPTVDEFMEINRKAIESCKREYGHVWQNGAPAPVSREQAEQIVKPLRAGGVA